MTSRVVDACVFHEWPSTAALAPYLRRGWDELILRPGDPMGEADPRSTWIVADDPMGRKLPGTSPADSHDAGQDLTIDHLFNTSGVSAAVLGFDDGLLASAFPNYHVAREVVRAANMWTAEEWLSRDERFAAHILVSSAVPEDAAEEIRRAGSDDRMVGVALGANGLGRPFGHAVYRPIHRAAAELSLPLVIQVGSDAASDLTAPPVAGGLPATHAEYRALATHSHMSHVASLIAQGVFEEFPDLKVLLVGGGASWIPGWLWRLDYWYKSTQRELPWLRRLPSDYFRESVRVATYQLERSPTKQQLATALSALDGMDEVLIYGSCFPNRDSESADAVSSRLPEAWRDKVLSTNALDTYRKSGALALPVAV